MRSNAGQAGRRQKCLPAPLRDAASCSVDDIAPMACPDLADPSLADFAPVTLWNLAENYLPGFAHRPSDLMALPSLLSAHRGFCVLLVQPLLQPTSSDLGEFITECFLIVVSAPALSPGGALVRPERSY